MLYLWLGSIIAAFGLGCLGFIAYCFAHEADRDARQDFLERRW